MNVALEVVDDEMMAKLKVATLMATTRWWRAIRCFFLPFFPPFFLRFFFFERKKDTRVRILKFVGMDFWAG